MKFVTVDQVKELASAAYNMAAAKASWAESNPCSVGHKEYVRRYFEAAETFDNLITTILQQEHNETPS